MDEKHCGNCLHARPLSTDARFINCIYEGPRYPDLYACDKWASRCIDEAHEEKVFDMARLKPRTKHYIFCSIDNKTGEGHLVVKLDFKFKTKTMLPDDIYRMTLQELLDMEDKRMSDILTKEELKVFAEHPFYHDKIELLEKLKTRTQPWAEDSHNKEDAL